MALIYRRFARDYHSIDLSNDAEMDMYQYETFGIPLPKRDKPNGFELGKKWMDVTIAMWKEDIRDQQLFVFELLDDGYPDWFLKRIGILKTDIPPDIQQATLPVPHNSTHPEPGPFRPKHT